MEARRLKAFWTLAGLQEPLSKLFSLHRQEQTSPWEPLGDSAQSWPGTWLQEAWSQVYGPKKPQFSLLVLNQVLHGPLRATLHCF